MIKNISLLICLSFWVFKQANAVSYSITDLGTLGGVNSVGLSINDNGSVVGWSETSSALKHAFVYDGNTMQDICTLGGRFLASLQHQQQRSSCGDEFSCKR